MKRMNHKLMFHLLGKQKRSGKWLTSIKFDYNYDDLCQLMLLGEAKSSGSLIFNNTCK